MRVSNYYTLQIELTDDPGESYPGIVDWLDGNLSHNMFLPFRFAIWHCKNLDDNEYDCELFGEENEEDGWWSSYQEEMIALSNAFPNTLFILEGNNEEYSELWRDYYYKGVGRKVWAQLIFQKIDINGWKKQVDNNTI